MLYIRKRIVNSSPIMQIVQQIELRSITCKLINTVYLEKI